MVVKTPECMKFKSPFYLLSADFEKDLATSIGHVIFRVIYSVAKCCVLHKVQILEEVEARSGVRMGCILLLILLLLNQSCHSAILV